MKNNYVVHEISGDIRANTYFRRVQGLWTSWFQICNALMFIRSNSFKFIMHLFISNSFKFVLLTIFYKCKIIQKQFSNISDRG